MRTFQKSTPEEIAEMKRLYKKGWTLSVIGKKFNKNHSSISYHINGRKHINQIFDGVGRKAEVPDFIKNNIEAEQNIKKNAIIEKEKRKKTGNCVVCGKRIRNIKFKKSNFCSLKCFTTYV